MTEIQEYELISKIIDEALREDLGEAGDVTSLAIFSPHDRASAIIKSKSPGKLSGGFLLKMIFSKISSDISINMKTADGSDLDFGTVICEIEGPVQGILAGERIALNFLQRLSGIASVTAQYTKAISHTAARLLDTRKTTPNLRILEKRAVIHGGGYNHRFGLFDMILIKDTHVKSSGGVGNALKKALAFRGDTDTLKIEVEVQSIDEFQEAIQLHPDRIMLDNMSIPEMQHCVRQIQERALQIELEASGNITLATIASVAETGVDFISCGAITHSAPALDIHLVIT